MMPGTIVGVASQAGWTVKEHGKKSYLSSVVPVNKTENANTLFFFPSKGMCDSFRRLQAYRPRTRCLKFAPSDTDFRIILTDTYHANQAGGDADIPKMDIRSYAVDIDSNVDIPSLNLTSNLYLLWIDVLEVGDHLSLRGTRTQYKPRTRAMKMNDLAESRLYIDYYRDAQHAHHSYYKTMVYLESMLYLNL
jgi:hypothetical protein